ncbi:MAG: radical SAM protein [Myxococcota bacterium]
MSENQTEQAGRVGHDLLRLTETFYSIQGESSQAGRPCVFVRLSRCNLRCNWCDTPYSFKGGEKQSIDQIMGTVADYGCNLVEITGGEPLLQPGVHDLMTRLCDEGYEVMIETSGSLDIEPVDERVRIIMDLKAPGSGEVDKNLYENLEHLKATDEVKIVILDREDFDWAVQVLREYRLADRAEVIFSPVHGELEPGVLSQWIIEERLPVRLGVQLHKYLGME